MDPQAVLATYEHALSLTRRMLELARNGDWEALVALESERGKVIDQLRLHDPRPADGSSKRKRELIRELLQLDEQIHALTQDWMHELRSVLGSLSTEQRLSRTYGT